MDAVDEMSAAVNSSLLVVILATTAAVSNVELEAFYTCNGGLYTQNHCTHMSNLTETFGSI